ncbi:DUF4183 domain-containing protein [Ectobacillus polymachus]|uniref:DUF4183 domain-containing protein n=1 Tax=Ectobacillus polymachus TaxID=1508806 RepID=UPI003A8C7D3D
MREVSLYLEREGLKITEDIYVTNAGGVPSLQAGLLSNRPNKAAIGSLYLDTRNRVFYRYNGKKWEWIITPINIVSKERPVPPRPMQTSNVLYFTYSDGQKIVYTDQDGLAEYGSTHILAPTEVSYINFFINGMLQPTVNYEVEKGKLTLLTENAPMDGVLMILQFITIYT